MDGISANDITNFVVTAAQRLRQLQTIQIIIRATSSSIQATYVILSTNPTLNYDSLSSQLQKSVDNGDFNNYLSQNAASIPGATALVNCTSASIDTEDTLPPSLNNDDNDETLSAGAIAGIVIGVVIFVAFVAACFYWLFVMKGSISSPTSSTNATPTAPSIPDVEMSSESEVKWTDNMIRKA